MSHRVRRPVQPNFPPRGRGVRPSRPPYPYAYDYRRNRTAEILVISIVVAGFVLLGLGGMLWAMETRLALGPTPTTTPTIAPSRTATPDFRATRVAEDMLTQEAYEAALLGILTPTPLPTATQPAPPNPTPTSTEATMLLPGLGSPRRSPTPSPPSAPTSPPATPTPNTIGLPIVVGDSPLPTATKPVQQPDSAPATATASPTPTETPLPTPVPPTATPTVPPPTPTSAAEPPTATAIPPSPTPSATEQPYIVNSLSGVMREQNTLLRIGPSTIYSTAGTIEGNAAINLIGRTSSGEWVNICCHENQPAWVRQAFVRPQDNVLQPGAPEDADPNDVRWLPVQPPPSVIQPPPAPTPPPEDTFPMYRYTRSASGRVPQIPVPDYDFAWPGTAQAGQALVSPPIVSSAGVLVGSADQHLYSFDRVNGNQRWRVNLGQPVQMAPMVYDGEIFVADAGGGIYAFEDRGNETAPIWNNVLPDPAVTSFNVYSDTLFISAGQGTDHRFYAVHRDTGEVLRSYYMSGPAMQYPVVGDQLVYVGSGHLTARDVLGDNGIIWERTDLADIAAAPLYTSPGREAQAELFVVDGANRIYCLDANTGEEIWSFENGEAAGSLSLTDQALIVAGNGYVKAVSRDSYTELWRTSVSGNVLGGPLSTEDAILTVTQSGSLQVLDAATGAIIGSAIIPSPAGGAPAISGNTIYVPGTDGQLYAVQGMAPP